MLIAAIHRHAPSIGTKPRSSLLRPVLDRTRYRHGQGMANHPRTLATKLLLKGLFRVTSAPSAVSLMVQQSALAAEQKDYVFLPPGVAKKLAPLRGQEAVAVLEAVKKKSSMRAGYWLDKLDPEVVRDSQSVKSAYEATAEADYVFERAGFNRFQWMIAVAGGGTDHSEEALTGFLEAVAGWIAADVLSLQFAPASPEVGRGVYANPSFEAARRYMPVPVHMRWASELICASLANEVADDEEKYAELTVVTPTAVSEIFAWVNAKGKHRDAEAAGSATTSLPNLSHEASTLLDALASPAASRKGCPFDVLMFDLGNEALPFVRFPSGIEPVSAREATYRLEFALFSLARRLLTDDKNRSDLFEGVVTRSLRLSSPNDLELAHGAARCPIPNTKNPGQTDFVIRDSTSTYIGECKSMVAAPRPHSVINNFTDDIGKATDQLDKRMEAFAGGVDFLVDEQPWGSPRESIYGLAVPFHDYGGAVWHHDCLPLVNGLRTNLAVIPVHQMVLVMRAMTKGPDLAAYIRFRAAWLERDHEIFDELDILVPFLFPDDTGDIESPKQFGVTHEARLSDSIPSSAQAWRRRLKTILQ